MKRNIRLYLDDIKRSIRKIESYSRGLSLTEFKKDDKTVDAVIRNIEIIGEAVRHLPAELKARHPSIPWAKIVGMRNKVTHEYFGVDTDILWETVRTDISGLKEQMATIEPETAPDSRP